MARRRLNKSAPWIPADRGSKGGVVDQWAARLIPLQPRGDLLQDAVHVLPKGRDAAGRDGGKVQRGKADVERRGTWLARRVERNWPDVGPRNRRIGKRNRELWRCCASEH